MVYGKLLSDSGCIQPDVRSCEGDRGCWVVQMSSCPVVRAWTEILCRHEHPCHQRESWSSLDPYWKRVLLGGKLDLIDWQMFCELTRLTIAYCPTIHVCLVRRLLLEGFRLFNSITVFWHRFCEKPARSSMSISKPSQITVDCKSVHWSLGAQ